MQTNTPRFSAYVASKAALDAFSRCIASEVVDDGVHITTIHMPLVRTPMIAPTKMYDAFPTITPDEAAEMITDAMITKPKKVATRLGNFGELLYAVAPKASDAVLNTAYKLFPDSKAAKGEKGAKEIEKEASTEQVAFAHSDEGRALVGPERRLKHWGWGYEDQWPSRAELEATAAAVAERLGFGSAPVAEPVGLEEVELRPPRLKPPGSFAGLFSDGRYERVSHGLGKAYRDVVRGFRGEFPNPPDLVAFPADESEVELVLAWCEEQGAAVVPFGGGTSVVGGVEARLGEDEPVVALDLRRLDRVLEVDPVSLAARIQAGATGPTLERQLREHGLTLRHFPQSFEFSTLGGWIATRAGGHFATLETHIDDLVSSVRALTPRGTWAEQAFAGLGGGPLARPVAARLGGDLRGDHGGMGAGSRASPLQSLAGGRLRRLRGGRGGGQGDLPVGPSPVELPPPRRARGRDVRRRRGRGDPRARLRVGATTRWGGRSSGPWRSPGTTAER